MMDLRTPSIKFLKAVLAQDRLGCLRRKAKRDLGVLLRRCAQIAFFFIGLVLMASAGTVPADARSQSRHAAFIVDGNTGAVLHQDDADELRHPASLTKMMTLYLTFETLEQAALMLLGLGPEIEVLEPPELRSHWRELAREVLRRAEGDGRERAETPGRPRVPVA